MAANLTRKRQEALDKVTKHLARHCPKAGDQAPGIASLARTLGLNVRMVQTAYELLEADGALEAVPKVGTFVRRSFQAAARPGVVTLYSQEYSELTGDAWRELVRNFEAKHSGLRVELAMTLDTVAGLRGADVLYMECRQLQELQAAGTAFLNSFGPPTPTDLAANLPLAAEFLATPAATWARPVTCGMPILFVQKPFAAQLAGDAAGLLDRVATASSAQGVGLCLFSFTDMLHWFGWGALPWQPGVESYLRQLATIPPPKLVTYAETMRFEAIEQNWLLAALRDCRCLAAVVPLWHAVQLDMDKWEAMPSPFVPGARVQTGAMAVAARAETPTPEAAVELARFIASPEAQRILAKGGNLPLDKSEAERHPFWEVCAANLHGGHAPDGLTLSPTTRDPLHRVELTLHDLRVRRLSPQGTMERIKLEWDTAFAASQRSA